MRQQQESLGCILFLAILITPLSLFFGFREIYFNITSIPTTAKLLEDKNLYGNTLEFVTKSGKAVIVERVNKCGLGRGKRGGCIPWQVGYGDTVNIRYSSKNFKNVRIETFGAYWNWFGYFILATIPPLGYYVGRWQEGY